MKWEKNDIDQEQVKELAARFSIDMLPASILTRRNITSPEDLQFFLEDDFRYLHNPFLFKDMENTVDRILAARDDHEQVLVFGDRDADGVTSIVLLVEGLRELGLDAQYALPMGDDPYGLTMRAVDDFAATGGTLILTVDCGISCREEIQHAADKGMDTIIIDHHNPPETLPPAVSIINPKVADSGYPFRDLAGCGVVLKVLQALRIAETDLYNQTFCLVNVRPGNEMLIIEAAKITNLMEVKRYVENIVPGIIDPLNMGFVRFVEGHEIFVYDAESQMKMMKKIFGPNVDIHLHDVAQDIWKVYPALSGKSLLRIKDFSRMARYFDRTPSEIDIFSNIFISFLYGNQQKLARSIQNDLDLVALGTLADLMPLRNENRILVTRGLKAINGSQRPGLREILVRQNLLGRNLCASDVAWQLTPVINAAGRMGIPDQAVKLFLTGDQAEREKYSETLCELNRERKRLGDEIWVKILPMAQQSLELHENRMVLISDETIHRGVTGILAARLVNYFKVPAAVIAYLNDSVVGSLRSTRGFDVKMLLEYCSDLFVDYGGHDYAAGFNMVKSNFPAFERRARDYILGLDSDGFTEEVLSIDAELPLSFLTPELAKVIDLFEPYGEGNPPLIFLTKAVRINQLDLMGKREQTHVRMTLDTGKYKFPAVFWNAAERVGRDFSLGSVIDIVFNLKRNFFQNTETLQIIILDLHAAVESADTQDAAVKQIR